MLIKFSVVTKIMKAPLARIVIASAIFLVLLSQIFAAPTPPPDSMTLGVELNDSFTYVVSKLINDFDPTMYMGPGKYSGIEIALQQGDTYTMSINNLTIGNDVDEGPLLEVTLANASHSIITEVPLAPGIGAVSFTNWTAWETLMSSDPITYFNTTDYLNHTIVRDYAEYSIEYWSSMYWNATATTIYAQLKIIYDVITGVSVSQGAKTYNYDKIGFSDIEFVILRQGYTKPPPPSSTSTTTTTSSTLITTSNTTSTVTTTTNTTTTATTSTNTTNSSTSSGDFATFTPSSTLERNTTESTAESPIEDESSSSEGDLQVPGFGAIISFTALIATFTLVRYKKH